MMTSLDWSVSIQCDWEETLAQDGGKAWVSFKHVDGKSVHDSIKKIGNELMSKEEAFTIKNLGSNILNVVHKGSNCRLVCVAPDKVYKNLLSGARVTNVDVSSGGLGVATTSDNSNIAVWETDTGALRRHLSGHLGEVYSARLFPSGVVVLSTGADMTIRIWNAGTGTCPVSLTGHTAPVTDIAIVSKGKNIVSVSKDGTARLWSCGEQKSIGMLLSPERDMLPDHLNCCDITSQSHLHPLDPVDRDEMEMNSPEVETEDKLLAVGTEAGHVKIINIAARTLMVDYKAGSPVNCVTWTKMSLVVGCEDGSVHILSGSGNSIVKSSTSPVLCGRYVERLGGVMVGRQDGSVNLVRQPGETGVRLMLSGPDMDPVYDPVYSIASDNNYIYTGCRVGHIRRYCLNNIDKKFQ